MHTPCSSRGCWLESSILASLLSSDLHGTRPPSLRLRTCTQPVNRTNSHRLYLQLYTRCTSVLRSCQFRCGTSSIRIVPYCIERWNDKSTSSILAAWFPPSLYPPALVADFSSTIRLRSIPSLPLVSIPSIRSASSHRPLACTRRA